ncbi:MAG TPA: pitrilysin family protein [Vicinamibacterales bacterium]|nr:pitrilysin family protein [Vicinamibacterales bacterium]
MTRRTVATLIAAAIVVMLSGRTGAQVANWPAESPPRPLPSRPVSFPPYELRTLPNGMQVIVVMHHEQPEVTMRILVRAGAAYDPPGKAGTASLVGSLLNQGTHTRTAQEIADAIDSIGGALDTTAGGDHTSASVLVMKDSFEIGMDMLADVVRRPAFAPEEIERQRRQAIQSLGVSLEDPGFIASAVMNRLIYGFHPYGFPDSGMPDTMAKITREDLREFHRRYFAPNNSILAIVGDITADEAMAAATRVFGDWPRQAVQPPTLPDPPRATRRIVVIDKPDSVQTAVRIGQLGVPRKTPDYMSLDQAVRILGGEGSNRLFRVLRSERGLTYSASADMTTMLLAGDIVAETDTRTEATAEAVRVIVDEFTRLQRERIGDAELAGAQAYMTGSFPLTIETPGAIARQVVNAVFFDLSLDDLRTYRQRANAVTPDDVLRVARTYVQPERLSIVMVGNASAFKEQLPKAGFGNYELISLHELDLTAANLKRR